MKKSYKIIVSFLLTIIAFSCSEDDNFIIEQAKASFTIEVPSSGSNIVLNRANPSNKAITVTWDDTKNKDVSYTVELAKAATDFAETFTAGSSSSNNFTLSVEELNSLLVNTIKINQSEASNLELRVVASNGEKSNTVTLSIIPFIIEVSELFVNSSSKSWDPAQAIAMNTSEFNKFSINMDIADGEEFNFIPTNASIDGAWQLVEAGSNNLTKFGGVNLSGYTAGNYDITVDLNTNIINIEEIVIPDNLFMVGSQNGWNNDDATQQFVNHANGIFTKVQTFEANAEFKLLPTSGSWSGDWGESKITPGTLVQDDEDNIKVAEAGTYLVTIDFNTLTFKLTNISTMFMVGSHNGWNNADASQQFNTSNNGVFTRIQTFDANSEFKLLPTSGSWDGDWGESKTAAGTIVVDDEDNIKVATAGTYVITLDFNTLSFNLKELPSNLYLVGSPNGWNNATAPAFTKLSEGVFEITQVLTASDEFKFLPQQGAWDNDWGQSKTHTGMLVRDDEDNIKSSGDGTFKITVDFNKGTVIIL